MSNQLVVAGGMKTVRNVVVSFPDGKLRLVRQIPRYCFTQQELDSLFQREVVFPSKENFATFFIGAAAGRFKVQKFCATTSCWLGSLHG